MKLERAKQRMKELEAAKDCFMATIPFTYSGKPQSGDMVYTIDKVDLVPPKIALIAGRYSKSSKRTRSRSLSLGWD